MKIKTSILLAFAIAGVSAHAQSIISWAYANGNPIPSTGSAGVVSATNWNLSTGATTLNYDNGTASGTTMSLAGGFGAWGIGGVGAPDADGTYNKAIFDGYYNCFSSTLTLGNISLASYNLYVYFSSDVDGRTGTISDGATTYSFATMGIAATSGANALFSQTTDLANGYPNADYAIFSGLTGSSQTLTITSIPNNGMGIAGFQIVAVPEPGTLALAGLGGLGLWVWRRRMVNR